MISPTEQKILYIDLPITLIGFAICMWMILGKSPLPKILSFLQKKKKAPSDHLELTLAPFILSDFFSIQSANWENDKFIVFGCLPGSQDIYRGIFIAQDCHADNWPAVELTIQ